MDDQQAQSKAGRVHALFPHLDPCEQAAAECTRQVVMVSRHIDHASATTRLFHDQAQDFMV